MWDEITNPFPNFNGAAIEIWEWISKFIPHYMTDVITDRWSTNIFQRCFSNTDARVWFASAS